MKDLIEKNLVFNLTTKQEIEISLDIIAKNKTNSTLKDLILQQLRKLLQLNKEDFLFPGTEKEIQANNDKYVFALRDLYVVASEKNMTEVDYQKKTILTIAKEDCKNLSKYDQLPFLIRHSCFLYFTYFEIDNHKEPHVLDKTWLLPYLIDELWVAINAYRIRKTYAEQYESFKKQEPQFSLERCLEKNSPLRQFSKNFLTSFRQLAKPGDEICFPIGFNGHAIYLNFGLSFKKEVLLRIDNLGDGSGEHETDKSTNKINPYFVDELKNNPMGLEDYIIKICFARFEKKETAIKLIYCLSDKTNKLKSNICPHTNDGYEAKEKQKVDNCVTKNYYAGISYRLDLPSRVQVDKDTIYNYLRKKAEIESTNIWKEKNQYERRTEIRCDNVTKEPYSKKRLQDLKDPSTFNDFLEINTAENHFFNDLNDRRDFYKSVINGVLQENLLKKIPPIVLSSSLPNVSDGNTPLHCAILLGHSDVANLLIPHYVEHQLLDVVNDAKRTPLHLAALYNNKIVFKKLLTAGASLDIVDNFLATPFYEACFGGAYSILQFLLTHPDEVIQKTVKKICDQPSEGGWTPLIAASANHHSSIIDELILYYQQELRWAKKNIEQRTNTGKTSLHFLVQHGDINLVKKLVSTTAIETDLLNELLFQTLTESHCEDTNIKMTRCLISIGAQVHCQRYNRKIKSVDFDYWTPLHIAADRSKKEAILFFLKEDKFLKYQEDEKGRVPFDLLFKMNHVTPDVYHSLVIDVSPYELVVNSELTDVPFEQALFPLWDKIKHNVIDQFSDTLSLIQDNQLQSFLCYKPFLLPKNNKRTLTVLQYLLIHCDEQILEIILQRLGGLSKDTRQVIINEPSHHKDTLLHLAIRYCKPLAVIKTIIELGADLQAKNQIDCTIIHEAACLNNDELFNYLMEQCPVREYPIYFEATQQKKWTPLLIACACCNDQIISYLLRHDFDNDINATNYLGETPLYLLVKANANHIDNKLQLVTQLIEKGALLKKTNNKYDAFGIAVLGKQYDILKQIKSLVKTSSINSCRQGFQSFTYAHLAAIVEFDPAYYASLFSNKACYTYMAEKKRLPIDYVRVSNDLVQSHRKKIRAVLLKDLGALSDEELHLSVHQQKEAANSFPTGSFDFLEVEKKRLRFVDKTQFIVDLFKSSEKKVRLITRPSRFGKSLALSMLYYFLDSRAYQKLVDTLHYDPFLEYKVNNDKQTTKHKGKYTVILINFLSLAQSSYPSFLSQLDIMMKKLYRDFSYLRKTMDTDERNYYDHIFTKSNTSSEENIAHFTNILPTLCDAITKYNERIDPFEKTQKHKPIILIDEFDAPLLKASIHNFFNQAVEIIQQVLILTLKSTEQAFEMAVLSGIIRVSGSKLLSTLNNISDHSSMRENLFADCFGFTEQDVKENLTKFNFDMEYPKLLERYGYYYCGNKMLFNPWSIANAVTRGKIIYENHWVKSQRDTFVKNVISSLSEQTKDVLKALLNEDFIKTKVTDQVSCIHPSNELSVIFYVRNQNIDQKTNYALLVDEVGKWYYRSADAIEENKYEMSDIDEQENTAIFLFLKKQDLIPPNKQPIDIRRLNESRAFKKGILDLLVDNKNIIRLDEKVWLLSLLYAAGFLTGIPFTIIPSTTTKEEKELELIELTLMIPNEEIYGFYIRELGLSKANYPYKKRSAVLEKISNDFFTQDKIDDTLNSVGRTLPSSRDILCLFYCCTWLDCNAISLEFLEKLTQHSDISPFINALEKNFFIDKTDLKARVIDLNPVVHKKLIQYFEVHQEISLPLRESVVSQIIQLLDKEFFHRDFRQLDFTDVQKFNQYYAHVVHLIDGCLAKHIFTNNIERLLYALAHHELFTYTHFIKAKHYLNTYINAYSHCFTVEKESVQGLRVASANTLLGITYHRLNAFEEAMCKLEEADKNYQRLTSDDGSLLRKINRWRAYNYINIGRVCQDTAENDKCLAAFDQAMALRPHFSSGDSELEQITFENGRLEMLYEAVRQGREKPLEAIEQAEQVNSTLKRYLGDRVTVMVARIKMMLAKLHCTLETEQHQLAAKELLDDAEMIIVTIFGQDHFELIDVFITQLQLHSFYPDYAARYQRAVALLEQASLTKSYTIFSKLNLYMGRAYYTLGFPEQAWKYSQDGLLPYAGKNTKPVYHPTLAMLKNVIGEAFRTVGRLPEASFVYEESYAISKKLYTDNHPYCFIELNNLGELYLAKLALKNAEDNFYKAWVGVRGFYGVYHIKTLMVHTNLVRSQFLQGQYTDLYHNSDMILETIHKTQEGGYDPSLVSDAIFHYGCMYTELKHYELAQLFLEKAGDVITKKRRAHPRDAKIASELMVAYAYLGDFKRALEKMRQANAIFEQHNWLGYPDYQYFLVNVLRLLYLMEVHSINEDKVDDIHTIKKTFKIKDPIVFLTDVINKYQQPGITEQSPFETSSYFIMESIKAKFLLAQWHRKQNHYIDVLNIANDSLRLMEGKLPKTYHHYALIYYMLADTYKKLSVKQSLVSKELPSYSEQSQRYFTCYQSMKRFIYSDTVICFTQDLKRKQLLGLIPVDRIEKQLTLDNTPDEIYFLEKEAINDLIVCYKELYSNASTKVDRTNLLARLIELTYVVGDYKETGTYVNIYKSLGETTIYIDVLILASGIPTDIEMLHKEMHLAIQELPVDTVLNRDRKARIYHNLACFYQVLAYQQKRFFGHLDQQQLLVRAESLFKEAIDIADLSSTKCAYLNLLYQQNKIDEMITLIQDKRYGSEWFNEGAEVNDDNIQIYSTVEKPVQVDALQQVIGTEKNITVNQKVLALYLFLLGFLKKTIKELIYDDYFVRLEALVDKDLLSTSDAHNKMMLISYYLVAHIAYQYYAADPRQEHYLTLANDFLDRSKNLYHRLYGDKLCYYLDRLKEDLSAVKNRHVHASPLNSKTRSRQLPSPDVFAKKILINAPTYSEISFHPFSKHGINDEHLLETAIFFDTTDKRSTIFSEVNTIFIDRLRQSCLMDFHWVVTHDEHGVTLQLRDRYPWDSMLRHSLLHGFTELLHAIVKKYEYQLGQCSVHYAMEECRITFRSSSFDSLLEKSITAALLFVKGEKYYYQGWLFESQELLTKAAVIYEENFTNQVTLFSLYQLLGDIHTHLGRVDLATDYYEKGLHLAEVLQTIQISYRHESILFLIELSGLTLQALDYEKAAHYLSQAEKLCEATPSDRSIELFMYAIRIYRLKLQFYLGDYTELYGDPGYHYLTLLHHQHQTPEYARLFIALATQLANIYLHFGSGKHALLFLDCATEATRRLLDSQGVSDESDGIQHPFQAIIAIKRTFIAALHSASNDRQEIIRCLERAYNSFCHFHWEETPLYGQFLINLVSTKRNLLITEHELMELGNNTWFARTNRELLENAESVFSLIGDYYLIEQSVVKLLLGIEWQLTEGNDKTSYDYLEKGLMRLEEKQGWFIIQKEFHFYLAKAALNLQWYAKAHSYFDKLENMSYEGKDNLFVNVVHWLDQHHLLGLVQKSHLQTVIHQRGNEITLQHFQKSMGNEEKTQILATCEAALTGLQNGYEGLIKKEAFATLTLIAYCLGKRKQAREYYQQLDALLDDNETEVFLEPFVLLTFVPCQPAAIMTTIENLLARCRRSACLIGSIHERTLYHALLIMYHAQACRFQLFGLPHVEAEKKVDSHFAHYQNGNGNTLMPDNASLAEYLLILFNRGQIDTILDWLRQVKIPFDAAHTSIPDEANLIYGMAQKPFLPPLLQYIIDRKKAFFVNGSILLAYLVGLCYRQDMANEHLPPIKTIIDFLEKSVSALPTVVHYYLLNHLRILHREDLNTNNDDLGSLKFLALAREENTPFLLKYEDYQPFCLPLFSHPQATERWIEEKRVSVSLNKRSVSPDKDSIDSNNIVGTLSKVLKKSLLLCLPWEITLSQESILDIRLQSEEISYLSRYLQTNIMVDMAYLMRSHLQGMTIEIHQGGLQLSTSTISDLDAAKRALECLDSTLTLHSLIVEQQDQGTVAYFYQSIRLGDLAGALRFIQDNEELSQYSVDELVDYTLLNAPYQGFCDRILEQFNDHPNRFHQSCLVEAYEGRLEQDCDGQILRETKTVSGLTVLHLAALGGHAVLVDRLITDNYFSPDVRDKEGQEPAYFARLRGYNTLAASLEMATERKTCLSFDTRAFIVPELLNKYLQTGFFESGIQCLCLMGAIDTCSSAVSYLLYSFLHQSKRMQNSHREKVNPLVFQCTAHSWQALAESYGVLAEQLAVSVREQDDLFAVDTRDDLNLAKEQVILWHQTIQTRLKESEQPWILVYTDLNDYAMKEALNLKDFFPKDFPAKQYGRVIFTCSPLEEEKNTGDLPFYTVIHLHPDPSITEIRSHFSDTPLGYSIDELKNFFNAGLSRSALQVLSCVLSQKKISVALFKQQYSELFVHEALNEVLSQPSLSQEDKVFYRIVYLACQLFLGDQTEERLPFLHLLPFFSSHAIPVDFLKEFFSCYPQMQLAGNIQRLVDYGILKKQTALLTLDPAIRRFMQCFCHVDPYHLKEDDSKYILGVMHQYFIKLTQKSPNAFHEARLFQYHIQNSLTFIKDDPLYADKDGLFVADLYQDRGDYLSHAARYKESLDYYQQALGLHEKAFIRYPKKIFVLRARMSNVSYCQGHYPSALEDINALLKDTEQVFGAEESLEKAECFNLLGLIYTRQSEFQQAITAYETALSMRKRCLSPNKDDSLIAQSLDNLSAVYYHQGNYQKALNKLNDSLPLFEKTAGKYHRSTVVCYMRHSLLAQKQGSYKEAFGWCYKAYAIAVSILGKHHQEMAYITYVLGLLYSETEDYALARHYLYRSLLINIHVLGTTHLHVATRYYSLADVYFNQANYAESEVLFKQAIQVFSAVLDEQNIAVAKAYQGISRIYLKACNFTKTKAYLNLAKAIYLTAIKDEKIEKTSPEFIQCQRYWGDYYLKYGDYKGALTHYHLVLNDELFSKDLDVQWIWVYLGLASSYYELKEYENSRKYLEIVWQWSQQRNQTETVVIAHYWRQLACVDYQEKHYDAALSSLQKSLAVFEKKLSSSHPDIAKIHNDMGYVYAGLGDLGNAEHYHQLAVAHLVQGETIELGKSYQGLGEVAYAKNDFTAASAYFQKSVVLWDGLLPEHHVCRAESYYDVARASQSEEKWDNAEKQMRTSLAIYQHHDHCFRKIIDCTISLGEISTGQKKYEGAFQYYKEALLLCEQYPGQCTLQEIMIYHGLGETSLQQENFYQALEYFEQALIRVQGASNTLTYLTIKQSMIKVLVAQNEDEKAVQAIDDILPLCEQVARTNYVPFISPLNRLAADIELKRQHYQSAFQYYQNALHYSEKHQYSYAQQSECAQLYERMGVFCLASKDFEQAMKFCLKLYNAQLKNGQDTSGAEAILKYLRKHFEEQADHYKSKVDVKMEFANRFNIYYIQSTLEGESSEAARNIKANLDVLTSYLEKLPLLNEVKTLFPEWQSSTLYLIKASDWQQMNQPIVALGVRKGNPKAEYYDLVKQIKNLSPNSKLFILTMLDEKEYAITGVCRIDKKRYQAVHVDSSCSISLLLSQVETVFSTSKIPLTTCLIDYYSVSITISLACDVLHHLQELPLTRFTAEGLWKTWLNATLQQQKSLSKKKETLSTIAQTIEIINGLSIVTLDGKSRTHQKGCAINNFFCQPLTLATPSKDMDTFFKQCHITPHIYLLFYGNLYEDLELARQIAYVRRFYVANNLSSRGHHIQWILDCEHELALRLSLENLASHLEGKKIALDNKDNTKAIQYGLDRIVTFVNRHQITSTNPIHIALVFQNIQDGDWMRLFLHGAKQQLSMAGVHCTFLFLMDPIFFQAFTDSYVDIIDLLTLPPLNSAACIQGGKQERLREENINLRKLSQAQRDLLIQLAFFVEKPLRSDEYTSLITLVMPKVTNIEAGQIWTSLKDDLLKEHWLEYDDAERGESCRYYITETLRHLVLKTFIHRETTLYTVPGVTWWTAVSNESHDDYTLLKTFLEKLRQEIMIAKAVLESSAFTQAGRLAFVHTFVKNLQASLHVPLALENIHKFSLHAALDVLMDAVYEEKLNVAWMIRDFITVNKTIEERFMADPSRRLKRAWALIKMGHLTVEKKRVVELIEASTSLQGRDDPVWYLESLIVRGIYYWYEGDTGALEKTVVSIEECLQKYEPLAKDAQWDLMKNEALLLKLRAYRFFIDHANQNKTNEQELELKKERYYRKGNHCYQELLKVKYNHCAYQLPEIYLEGALLAHAKGKWGDYTSRLEAANKAGESMPFSRHNPVMAEIFKQLSLKSCRKKDMEKAYAYCSEALRIVKQTFNHYQPDKLNALFSEKKNSQAAEWISGQFEEKTATIPIEIAPSVQKTRRFLIDVFDVAFDIYLQGLYGDKSPNTLRLQYDIEQIRHMMGDKVSSAFKQPENDKTYQGAHNAHGIFSTRKRGDSKGQITPRLTKSPRTIQDTRTSLTRPSFILGSPQEKAFELLGLLNQQSSLAEAWHVYADEMAATLQDENTYYTESFINLLLQPLRQNNGLSLCVYPSISLEQLHEWHSAIVNQVEGYVFVPLNVPYDDNQPKVINHWAALIVDKKYQMILYLDPAKKTRIPAQINNFKKALHYETFITNPINFQENEMKEGLIRHCGAYVVELYKVFARECIQKDQCISGSQLSDPSVPHSLSALTVFGAIPSGDPEQIKKIRASHIEDAYQILVGLGASLGNSENGMDTGFGYLLDSNKNQGRLEGVSGESVLTKHSEKRSIQKNNIAIPSSGLGIDSYKLTETELERLKSNTLADTEADDNDILAFLKIKLKHRSDAYVPDQPWKLQVEKNEKAMYFKQTTFPLIDFFSEFLGNSEKTSFVLPLMPNSAHHCGLIITKEKGNDGTQLTYTYINPETHESPISATDNKVFDEIQIIDTMIFELLENIQTVEEGKDYVLEGTDNIYEITADKIEIIKNLAFQNPAQLDLRNKSCKQQTNNRDCGYIVGQTLYELVLSLPFSIPAFDANYPDLSIKAIAQARTNFGAEDVISKDNIDAYVKRQYYQRLAKAMAGVGETKECWEYIKNADDQRNRDGFINGSLIQELQTFIKIYDLKDKKIYVELHGILKEDKLFNFLNNSKILAPVSAGKIKETCNSLLQYQLDAINPQNIYYVLRDDIKNKKTAIPTQTTKVAQPNKIPNGRADAQIKVEVPKELYEEKTKKANSNSTSDFYLTLMREALLYGDEVLNYISEDEDNFSKTNQQLKANAAEFGYACDDVPGDGNCFYSAMVLQLSQMLKLHLKPDSLKQLAKSLRKFACEHIEQHRQIYEEFFDDSFVFENQKTDEIWVEDIVITALCYGLNINLIIIRNDSTEPNIKKLPNAVGTLYLGYQVELHYQSLIPLDTINDKQKQAALHNKLTVKPPEQFKAPITITTQEELKEKLKRLLQTNETKVCINQELYNELMQNTAIMGEKRVLETAIKNSLEIIPENRSKDVFDTKNNNEKKSFEYTKKYTSTKEKHSEDSLKKASDKKLIPFITEKAVNAEGRSGNNPKAKASENFKTIISALVGCKQKTKRFSFVVKAIGVNELRIELTTPMEKIPLTVDEIKKHCISLQDALESDLSEKGLQDGEHYDIEEFDSKIGKLIIKCDNIVIRNRIGCLLQDAGLGYWGKQQLMTTSVFFKPERKQDTINTHETDVHIDEIDCRMQ